MSSGEAAKNVQDSSSQREKVEEVPCIVKFRPCKDWSGEYGFDWVREGKEDYEEIIKVKKSISLVEAPGSFVGYIPKEIAIKMLKKQWGEEKYEKWRKEKRKTYFNPKVANPSYIDENGELIVQDEKTKQSIETYVDGLASAEIKENQELYDETAWLSDSRFTLGVKDSLEFDEGAQPMEYFYSPDDVKYVKYYLNTKELAGMLRSEVCYCNMGTGNDEAEKARYSLDYLINTPDTQLSLMKKDNGYVLPYYREKEDIIISINNEEKIIIWEKISGKWKLIETITGVGVLTKVLPLIIEDRFYIEYASTNKKFDDGFSFKKLEYTQKGIRIVLVYWHINGNIYLSAKWKDLLKSYQLFFKDGNPISLNQGERKRWFDIEEEVRSRIKKETQDFFTEGILLDRDLKDLEAIMGKVKNKEIDDVVLTIFNPYSHKEYDLPADELTKDSLDRDCWNGNRIISWQELYEDSFSQLNIRLKKKKESVVFFSKEKKEKEQEPKYCVPELSISHEDIERTNFVCNTIVDAPITKKQTPNEYPLQIRFAGDCDELRFESDQPDSFDIIPNVIQNPKDKDTITVKYLGKYVPSAKINAIGVKKYLIRDTKKLVGQLKVRVNLSRAFKVLVVKVVIGGLFSKKMEDCLTDQFDFFNNVLSQVGMKADVSNVKLDIDQSQIEVFCESDKIDYYASENNRFYKETIDGEEKRYELGDFLIKTLVGSFGEEILLMVSQALTFFILDKEFTPSGVLAFKSSSDLYSCDFVIVAKGTSIVRVRYNTIAHEAIHAMKLGHVFQLDSFLGRGAFCFPCYKTSNVMDYSRILYSLHKFQWDRMIEAMAILESERLQALYKLPCFKKELKLEKRNKQKRDRVFSNKMDGISKSSSLNKRN